MPHKKYKILVCSGGGSRGIIHLGAMQYLNDFDYNSKDIDNIICFMKHLFCYDINDRFSAKQCLNHSFLS